MASILRRVLVGGVLLAACGPKSPAMDATEDTGGAGATTSDGGVPTTGDAVPCDDPRGPGCIPCGEFGPSRLVGLTWNFAGAGAAEELRCIAPDAGDSVFVAEYPDMDWLDAHTHDRAAGVAYVVAHDDVMAIHRLFTLDLGDGALLGSPALDTLYNWSGGLHVRSDGQLVGITWNTLTMQEELRMLDPATGETSLVAAIPTIEFLHGAHAYDRSTDRAVLLGPKTVPEEDAVVDHLFVVDAHDGALLVDVALDASKPSIDNLFVRADGVLMGVTFDGTTRLSAIDPFFATIEPIADLVEIEQSLQDSGVYDEFTDTLYGFDGDGRLVAIGATTGALKTHVELAPPGPALDYNWSGGLFLR